ncbi:LytR C-terminal domain-containing protein [Streptomyces sp. NPDC053499]|uniref:LytR C-terminal domain-containing protein n=1 Tax=Streptomyces sp. NPDC053499 TaxID=3365707 RepID=UPI0037D10471
MSMLTPPGLGGKYRIKGDRYPRMRRPRRRGRLIAATFASVLAVAVLGWGTLQLVHIFSDPDPVKAAGHPAGPAKCASPAASGNAAATGGRNAALGNVKTDTGGKADGGKAEKDGKKTAAKSAAGREFPRPGDITVNVLNATSRSGLAKNTADELKKRGFKIGKIGNASAEFDEKVEKAGILIGAPGSSTSDRLQVLGTQLENTETRYDERDGKDVDLILGKGFEHLTKKKAATAALAELAGSPHPGKSSSASPATC